MVAEVAMLGAAVTAAGHLELFTVQRGLVRIGVQGSGVRLSGEPVTVQGGLA